jgi:lysozyme
MKLSRQGLDFIKSFEGFVPYVYDDLRSPVNGKYREWNGEDVRGTLTIGYGHTDAAKHPLKIKRGLRITEEEATQILDTDLDECEEQVAGLVKVPLTQGQFDALVSFNFNCGPGNLKELIVPLNKGDYKACRAKFDLYVKSKGQTLRGLQRRRDGEQALWDSNIAPEPEEIVDHPAEVEAEPEPVRVGPVGATVVGGGAVGATEGVRAAAGAIPSPPQQLVDAFSTAGVWKGMGESAVMFGAFAYERPLIVGAIVVTVLFLTFGLKILPQSWRPS